MSEATSSSTGDASKSTSSKQTSVENIEMIGSVSHQIVGTKLPSKKELLQLLLYNTRVAKLSTEISARLAIKAASVFWEQARIPIRKQDKCEDELMKLYKAFRNIQRTVPDKRSTAQQKTAEDFNEQLDDLFDIATTDALESIKAPGDRDFLIKQRQKGRPGSMPGADMKLLAREKRTIERKEKQEERKRKHHDEMSQENGI